MNKWIKATILLLTAVLVSLLLFYNVFTLVSNVKDRYKKAGTFLSPYRSYLFQKINLNYQPHEIDFSDVDNRLRLSHRNYIGYEVVLAQEVLFSTPSLEPFANTEWKKVKVTSQAFINRSKSYAQLVFTNNNTGHQFKVVIQLIDQPFLLHLLIINAIAISIYLFLLILLMLTLFFYNKKNPRPSKEKPTVSSQKGEFILSEEGYEKYQDYLSNAIATQKPFSIGLIKNSKDSFDEQFNPEGFTLLKTHITLNHGYLEWNEQQMVLLLPNTPLKEAMRLVEGFFARYIEENLDIALNAGLSTLNQREVTTTLLTKEASEALKRAKKESENWILGFDADPIQYKLYLKKKKGLVSSDH